MTAALGSATNAQEAQQTVQPQASGPVVNQKPKEFHLNKTGRHFDGDLRSLPYEAPVIMERPKLEPPISPKVFVPPAGSPSQPPATPQSIPSPGVAPSAPAPGPIANFDGLDFATWGAGHPPDTNGDVGPTYYIQAVNSSVGIFRKSDGVRVAAFFLNTFMSQGAFGNLCDTNNFGDPYVLYDTFEDRWIITDFAFQLSAGNVINPPGAFQCFAVSKTGDPVTGGWNFYSINTTGGLGDYPKFGIWPDGLYMSVNMFNYPAGGSFQSARVYAFNKGSGTDNANFSTPPDGTAGRMQMFRFTGATIDRDGGLDAEVVLHELTHGTSNRLVGNAAGLNWDQARGMGEGWSDFYALSLLNNTNADDPYGRYASGAYATYKLNGTLLDNYVYA